ncbi:TolC family protein [Sediminibacterium sp.]|uniref:TolC family protein n=1 Tax=Sediminibacterium sp. TaxID=1917865 RepID=UPI0025D79EE7|nr:TolC family protein [Sediminibacterium sp.]
MARMLGFFLLIAISANAQDTLTLKDCENLFQKNNLQLLSEQYNIASSKAAVIQAKIWEQPYISGELNFFNPNRKQLFDIGNKGQKAFAIQQLIYMGGKKKAEIEFAQSNVAIAELQYEELLRNLSYQLKTSFYEIYFGQLKIKQLERQIGQVDELIKEYSVQADKGNVALKEVVRLESLALSLRNDINDIQKSVFAYQENLQILTNTSEPILAVGNENELNRELQVPGIFTLLQLQQKAIEKNPNYLKAVKLKEQNEINVRWQKALAKPDLTVGGAYDQNGGAFSNQLTLTLGMSLPFKNKNRGNIKMAESMLTQSSVDIDQSKTSLSAQLATAYNNLKYQQNQLSKSLESTKNFDAVYAGVIQNFQKRNISLIEFTDFIESYNQSILYINEIKKQIILSKQTINYITNENIF